jgi:membrane protein implicated in regulation of membrane protease activity
VRPELFLYVLAAAMIVAGIIVSYIVEIPVVGLGFLIIGVLLFLLPSMRRPERRL